MLKAYRAKRDFTKTAEPAAEGKPGNGSLSYVIQEHHASHLHWDLRLECDGVLKSWAVPKGPPTATGVRRLAVMVEDHPLAYRSFEGTIPKGEYGGGEVIIWDRGVYAPDEPKPIWDDRKLAQNMVRDGLAKGKLSFTLSGNRLKGSWALVRLAKSASNWLLIKHADRNGAIAAQGADVKRFEPMLCVEQAAPFEDAEWAFEPKLDGIRVIAYKNGTSVEMVSRGGEQIADRFSSIANEIRSIDRSNLVLDGEIVAFDEKGRPNFEKVMAIYYGRLPKARATYYLFDLLRADGKDYIRASYTERRGALAGLGLASAQVRVIESFPQAGCEVFDHAVQLGFEGVVAKRLEAPYQPGRRSRDWRKIKRGRADDFYVCGWLAGKGHRSETFGSLLLCSLVEGVLVYRGNVGGGFSDRNLTDLFAKLQALATAEPQLKELPKLAARIHWVKPELLIEVKYMTETNSGRLRSPTFVKLRDAVEKPRRKTDSKPVEAAEIIDALTQAEDKLTVHLDGHQLNLTSLNKELWPKTEMSAAFSKRDLFLHYARSSAYILPHLKDRPMAFVRYPDGLGGPHFFQKHLAHGAPSFLKTVDVHSASNGHAVAYLVANSLLSLLWLAQMGALELHPWQSRISPADNAGTDFVSQAGLEASSLARPDFIVLDLDPYTYSGKERRGAEPELNRNGWNQVVEVAQRLHESLVRLNITAYLKTSGKTGLHIFVPVERSYSYAEAREFARTLGDRLMRDNPELITMEWSVKKRPAKVYFDAGQNALGKTLAAIYSTRPTPGALVSFPIQWEDLPDIYPTDFSIATAPGLLDKQGDLWAGIASDAQRIV